MRTFVDLVCVTATSSGAGPFTLGNALTGFFGVERLQDGATYSYSVQQDSNVEFGSGTYVAATATLTRNVRGSTNGGLAVEFAVGASVAFTFLAADIADILREAGNTAATAKAAFNSYGLQWAVWFNGSPVENELLALYSAATALTLRPNFEGATTAPPLTNPAAPLVLLVQRQTGGSGFWSTVGSVTIGTDGSVALATASGEAVPVLAGDRLRVVAPPEADTAVSGFCCTFKGYIP